MNKANQNYYNKEDQSSSQKPFFHYLSNLLTLNTTKNIEIKTPTNVDMASSLGTLNSAPNHFPK